MADEPKTQKKDEIDALGIAQGVGMNLPFSTPYFQAALEGKSIDDQLQELRNSDGWGGEESGPSISQLVAMRRMDGQARALYRLLTRPILAALDGFTIVPSDSDHTKESDFIQQVFTLPGNQGGMSVSTTRFMAQLLQALFDGFAPFEKVYYRPAKGPLKNKTVLKKLLYLPPETITFITDNKGSFRGLRQQAAYGGDRVDVYLEPKYSFYYAAQEEERQFYGVSYFQSAFYHYDKKMKSYFLAHLAAQRSAVGTRVGTVPATATNAAKQEFNAALSNLAFAQFMAFPEGFKVEILREGSNFDFLNYINHHNSQMSKSILATFFDQSQGSGSNDNAMIGGSGPGDDWFMLQLGAIQDEIAAAINAHIIPDLIDENFQGGNYPTFKWGSLSEEQEAAIRATFERLSMAGQATNVTPEFMRALEENQAKAMGLAIDYDAIAAREQKDAQMQIDAGIDPKTGQPFPQAVDPTTGQPFNQPPAAGAPGAPGATGTPFGAPGAPVPPGGAPVPGAPPAASGAAGAQAPAGGQVPPISLSGNPDQIAQQFQQQVIAAGKTKAPKAKKANKKPDTSSSI